MNKAITSTMDLRATLEILLEKIKGLLPYSAATIRLFNNKNGLLEPVVCRNLDKKEWKVERRKGDRSLATLVLETKAPIIVKYAQADPRDRDPEFCQKHNVISYLGVPLIVKEEVLGMLNLYSREELFYDYRFQKPLVC